MAKKAKKRTSRSARQSTSGSNSGGSIYDKLKKQYDASNSGSRNFRFPEGKTTIRLVPFEHDGEEEVFVEEVWHYGVMPGGGGRIACLGHSCPFCELRDQMDDQTWLRVRPSQAYLANAVVRGFNGGDDQCVVVQMPKTVYNELVEYITGGEYKDVLDPKRGRDFHITRTGQKMKTRYKVHVGADRSSLGGTFNPTDIIGRQRDIPSQRDVQEVADKFEKQL